MVEGASIANPVSVDSDADGSEPEIVEVEDLSRDYRLDPEYEANKPEQWNGNHGYCPYAGCRKWYIHLDKHTESRYLDALLSLTLLRYCSPSDR